MVSVFDAGRNLKHRVKHAAFVAAERAAGALASYHHARLDQAGPMPSGPVLLVGNHGTFGYETPVFFHLLHQATGRYPLGLADHAFFRIPGVRTVLPWLGGVRGTRENALTALAAGNLVVCYPGGAREVFKHRRQRYQLQWAQTLGFAQVASDAGATVIPFAGLGVDDAFALLDKDRFALRLTNEEKYSMPVGMPLPLPARFRFVLGECLTPPPRSAALERIREFKDRVAAAVEGLLQGAAHA